MLDGVALNAWNTQVITGIRKSGKSILMQEYETIKHEAHST